MSIKYRNISACACGIAAIFSFYSSAPLSAAEFGLQRQHTITLTGAVRSDAPATLSVAQLTIEFAPLQVCVGGRPDEERRSYEGVSFQKLIAKYGLPDVKHIKITSVDSYQQTFDKVDWENHKSFLVFRSENEILSTRRRGTFRVIFDLKRYPEMLNKVFNPKTIWSVSALEFLK